MRVTGSVRFFKDNGYGFILPDDGGPDVFVHRTDLVPPLTEPKQGDRVSYELVDSSRGNGKKASKVELVP